MLSAGTGMNFGTQIGSHGRNHRIENRYTGDL